MSADEVVERFEKSAKTKHTPNRAGGGITGYMLDDDGMNTIAFLLLLLH